MDDTEFHIRLAKMGGKCDHLGIYVPEASTEENDLGFMCKYYGDATGARTCNTIHCPFFNR